MPSTENVLAQIEHVFDSAPRPDDEALLHAESHDDMDIVALYDYAHWRDIPDDVIEQEYAALFFLSPGGFRHFLPAYLSWVLRHPDSGAAVIESTLIALDPAYSPTETFSLSKYSLLNTAQREAVIAFLDAIAPHEDVSGPLAYWQG